MAGSPGTAAPPGYGGAPDPGPRVGPYSLVRELGRGGMGIVYAARHVELGRDVALKLLLSEQASPQAIQRFQVEAQALAQLRHPNVVGVHEVGVAQGRAYLVMDLVEGESLQDRLQREGALAPDAVLALCEALAEGLAHAHEHSILHRDLKPANVLLSSDGRPVITDFGLARQLGDERERLTQTGQTLGTPAYMPPEQIDGEADPRSDVYSLGATLYAALAGCPPFSGASPMNVLNAVLLRAPEPLSTYCPELDPNVEAVCHKCLEKEPSDRYQSASELAQDLGRLRRGESVSAQSPAGRRARWPLVAGLLVIVAVVAAVFALRKGEEKTAPSKEPTFLELQAERRAAKREEAEASRRAEGKEKWTGITYRPEGREKLQAAHDWLLKYAGHALEQEVRDFVRARAPVLTISAKEARAWFFGPSRALVRTPGEIRLWSLDSKAARELRAWKGTGGVLMHVAVADSKTFAYTSLDSGNLPPHPNPQSTGSIWLASLSDKSAKKLHSSTPAPNALAASPAGDLLAFGQEGKTTVLELPSGRVSREIKRPGLVQGIAFCSSRTLVTMTGGEENAAHLRALELWDLSVQDPEPSAKVSLGFSNAALDWWQGRLVVGDGPNPLLYQVGEGRIDEITSLERRLRTDTVAVKGVGGDLAAGLVKGIALRDGRIYVLYDWGVASELRVWDTQTFAPLLRVQRRRFRQLRHVAASGSGRLLISSRHEVELWDLSRVKAP